MLDRFDSKVQPNETDCLVWIGTITRKGYGQFWDRGQMRAAHRVAYEREHGAIPPSLEIDHLCQNRACVNPAHLEAVPHRINCQRSTPALAATCKHGHEYTPENTYVQRTPWGTQRTCRTCTRMRLANAS